MDNMPEASVHELQTEVAVLKTRVEGLEQGRFAALEAKVDASREVLEAKIDTNRTLIEHNDQTLRALLAEQGKRLDDQGTRMDRLEAELVRTRNLLLSALGGATAIIAVIQFLTR